MYTRPSILLRIVNRTRFITKRRTADPTCIHRPGGGTLLLFARLTAKKIFIFTSFTKRPRAGRAFIIMPPGARGGAGPKTRHSQTRPSPPCPVDTPRFLYIINFVAVAVVVVRACRRSRPAHGPRASRDVRL